MTEIYYIVYISKPSLKTSLSTTTLIELTQDVQSSHLLDNITGFLCYDNNSYFHYTEGSLSDIAQLQHSLHEKYYRKTKILLTGQRSKRIFEQAHFPVITFNQLINHHVPAHVFLPFSPHKWTHIQLDEFIIMLKEYTLHYDDFLSKQSKRYRYLPIHSIKLITQTTYQRLRFSLLPISKQTDWLPFVKVLGLFLVLIAGLLIYNLGHSTVISKLTPPAL